MIVSAMTWARWRLLAPTAKRSWLTIMVVRARAAGVRRGVPFATVLRDGFG